jgi:DNA-3-methyladenine glycosylase
MHNMLNLVTGADGEGAAVLIRACEPVRGHELILERRKSETMRPVLLTGPGKVASALALDTSFSGHALFRPRGVLSVREGDAPGGIVRGPRVGIGYASAEDQAAPWRLAVADNLWVSARSALSSKS